MNKYIIYLSLISFVLSVNMDAAVNYLISHAQPSTTGWCAQYVHRALEAGGFILPEQPLAYQYRANGILTNIGYKEISRPSSFKKGDITVTERNSYHTAGHMAMWSGSSWISDFVQLSEFVYYENQPPVYYFRYEPNSSNDGGCNGKSVNQIAREVIYGSWGNGDERKRRLTAAGCDYAKVQAEVNKILYG